MKIIFILFINMNLYCASWVKIDSADSTIDFASSINIIEDSFEEITTSNFTVKAKNKNKKYDVWLNVDNSNWDSNINKAFATLTHNGKQYRLPLEIELFGTTNSGIEVNTSINENINTRPTGSTLTGNKISGTRKKNGDTFTIKTKVNKTIIGTNTYLDFPSGIYLVSITLNVLLDKD